MANTRDPANRIPSGKASSDPRVLLTVADEENANGILAALQNAVDVVVVATDTNDLQHKLAQQKIDLVILDDMVVDTDDALCRQMRTDHGVSIILLSTDRDQEHVAHRLQHSVDDYLIHPVDADELAARVQALLRRRRTTVSMQERTLETAGPMEERPSCPHLGLQQDRRSVYAEPTSSHRCYATDQATSIELEHQTKFCLATAYENCPRYVEIVTEPDAVASTSSRFAFATKPVFWLLTMIAVVLGIGYVYFSGSSEAPASAADSGAAAAAVLATSTPTTTATPAPAEVAFVQATSTATSSPTVSRATEPAATGTPAVGRRTAILVPVPNAVGWVASGENNNHFAGQNIHAGMFEGEQYYGALQFRLDQIPAGATIEEVSLELVGLSAENLGDEGTWTLRLLDPAVDENWESITYQQLSEAPVLDTIPPELQAADLAARQSNVFTFTPEQLQHLERRLETRHISFRLDGPSDGESNLFTWDTGARSADRPELRVVYNLPPTPTPAIVVNTPTPANVATEAAVAARATFEATAIGTPTPLPVNYITATPQFIIVNTPTPENEATAQALALEATARAFLFGTPTPFPAGAMTATPLPPTPMPSSTPTATPLPRLIPLDEVLTPTVPPADAVTPTPATLPNELKGKIVFRSDRLGGNDFFVMEPNGAVTAWLTDRWVYTRAGELESFSPDRSQRAFVQSRDDNGSVSYEIWVENPDGFTWHLAGGNRATYSPSWSPDGTRIAFVSQIAGNDEIYVIDIGTKQETRLTTNEWQWDKHPSWSPDGSQIIFWTNRGESGRGEIWIMNADGTDQRPLLQDAWNNWDPIWIK